ncbi:MAG: sigma 54-interacting transcriptional regulator [Myxococcales bacterium]|nr:sigma 54-interacting transcriptional regulator [Myxococcales bacterium]
MRSMRKQLMGDDEGTTQQVDPVPSSSVEALCLIVIGGPDTGLNLDLEPGRYIVGKSRECALALADTAVSRQHLELEVDRWGVVVRDLDSKNGSYYYGARFREVVVGAGAVVQIGGTQLKLARRPSGTQVTPSERESFGQLCGRSLVMRELFTLLERVSTSEEPVLIEGETGTGKELCAEAIHRASPRARGPLVVCDLAGVPRTLIESELFGHVKGAFTGAAVDRVGAFESAHRGTVFLDEVGELEADFQPRLLRALENHTVRRVGSAVYRDVDVRIIAATNRDLAQEVESGSFRSDVFHRLSVVRVRLPALRERKEDIPLLVEKFLAGTGVRVASATLALLQEYDWPGNVRELKNVLRRGVALNGEGGTLEPEHLGLAGAAAASPERAAVDTYHEAKAQLIETWEKSYVRRVLDETGGNVSQAARECGLGRAYLHRLIRKYQLG